MADVTVVGLVKNVLPQLDRFGKPMLSVDLAERYWDKRKSANRARYWRVLVFDDVGAALMGPHLKPGTPVYVCGKLETEVYMDKEGQARVNHRLIAASVILMPDSKTGEWTESSGLPKGPIVANSEHRGDSPRRTHNSVGKRLGDK